MNNTHVLFGLRADRYAKLEELLESYYVISANFPNQQQLLDAIPKFKPHALIIDLELKGTGSFDEFYKLVQANFPDLRIIIFQEDLIHLVEGYITGEIDIPVYGAGTPGKQGVQDNEAADQEDVSEQEDQDPGDEIQYKKYNNMNRSKGKGSKLTDEELLDDFALDQESEDWERTTEVAIDIHDNLKKLVVVTGASGGIGKTDMSINIAVHAMKCGFKTVLCGFNLQNDDIAGRLGLEYKRGKKLMTAFELYTNKRLNIAGVEDIMQDYRGLKVLVGIEKPEERQDMDEEFFKQMVRILKANYDLVIVDTENNSFSPAYHSLIEIADHIIVPCTSHNSVLTQLRDELFSWKEDFDIPLSKVDVILNKADEGGFVTKEHVEKNTTREVIAVIPHSKDVLRGSEREEPAVLRHSSDGRKIRKEMDKVVFRLTGRKVKSADTVKPSLLNFRKKVKKLVSSNKAN